VIFNGYPEAWRLFRDDAQGVLAPPL